ncbi:MAG: AI-2E family transporter [Bacteroidota bacterium]
MSISRLAYLTIALIGFVYFLIVAKDLLQPIVIAGCIWYVTRAISDQIAKLGLPKGLCTLLASVTIIVAILFSIEIIANNVNQMIEDAPTYQQRVVELKASFLETFNIEELPSSAQLFDEVDLQPLVSEIGTSLSSFAGNLALVIVYAIFLIMEQATFPKKWRNSFTQNESLEQATMTVKRISASVREYISVKTGVSLLTAALSWLVMWLVGLEYAIFWAFIIFLLNYIPSIGSLLATAFPVLFSILQFETFTNTAILLVVISVIQFSVANLLEPMLMGRTLNISGLVTLISLSLWGAIWGITGMILSVPIMVTVIIVCSEFSATRPVAVWLSSDGNVLTDEEWEEAQKGRQQRHHHARAKS